MTGHITPVEAAERLRATTGADEVLREFMRTNSSSAPLWWDVGVGGEILVIWPGWNESRDPMDYLKVVAPG